MTISLSIDRMTETILALNALDIILSPTDRREAMTPLTADNRPALRVILFEALARVTAALMPYVDSTDLDAVMASQAMATGDLTVALELKESRTAGKLSQLRGLVEEAVTAYALHLAMCAGAPDVAERHHSRYEKAVAEFCRMGSATAAPCRRPASW